MRFAHGIALGLFGGFCLAVVVLLSGAALDPGDVHLGETSVRHEESPSQNNGGHDVYQWWPLISQSNTLTDWLAVAASAVGAAISLWAVFLLRGTLTQTITATEAAQAAVATAREMGEAQVRSYIYTNSAEINAVADTLTLTFRNYGNSPGSISCVDCFVVVHDPYAHKTLWDQRFWHDGFTVAPHDATLAVFRLDRGRGAYLKRVIDEDGIAVSVQGRFQSVDVFRQPHEHGVNITLSDGIRAN